MQVFQDKELGDPGSSGTTKYFAVYIVVNILIGFIIFRLLNNWPQTLAATIFIALVIGTLMFWKLRVAIAFIGIVILLLTGTIDLPSTIEFMNLDVILFLIGMMVMVGLLRRSGCFRWMLFNIIKAAKFRVNLLMVILLVLSAVMAALLDEVTSILLMSTLVLDLCDFYKINPVNYIISVVLATNIGSSWTVLGNPVGVMIALRSGLTFEDYVVTALPVGVIALISLIIIILIWQKGDLRNLHEKIQVNSREDQAMMLGEWCEVKDKRLFRGSLFIFTMVIVGLALHYRLELAMGLAHNTLLVGFSIAGAGVAMLWRRNEAKDLLTKEVDWWTLIFFMFIFVKAGSLKYVGITDIVSNELISFGGGNLLLLIPLILILSGVISSVLDNVLVVAMLIPVMQSMTASLGTNALWWALLFGSCYGGNMTMIGSTANIVSLGILEERKGYHMTLKYWFKIGFLGGLIPMAIATGLSLLMFL